MTFWEILLIGVALSMDAFAVSAVSGMNIRHIHPGEVLLLAVCFGGFQGLMPLIGFYAGGVFAAFMQAWARYIAFLLLAFVGGKMLWDSLRGGAEAIAVISLRLVLLQAVATSIDALAVGVSFAALGGVDIWRAAALIAACTFCLTIAAVRLGSLLGAALANRAGAAGGLILIAIGIKMLL